MSERHGHLRAVQAYIVVHNSTDIRYRYPIVGTNRLLTEYLPLLAYLGLRAQEGVGGWGEQIHALTGAALCVSAQRGVVADAAGKRAAGKCATRAAR